MAEFESVLQNLIEPQLQVSEVWGEYSSFRYDDVFGEGIQKVGSLEGDFIVLHILGKALAKISTVCLKAFYFPSKRD